MANVHVLDFAEVEGEKLLGEARAEVRKFQKLGCKVPKMEIKGGWIMNGFDFDFDEWVDAYPPLGNRYVEAGPRRAKVAPTETSECRIYFVHSGEGITDDNPLSDGDLFAGAPMEEEEAESDAPAPPAAL